jgi:hypothetical protein
MRYLTTLVAVATALCLCGTAFASSLEPPGTTAKASPAATPQVDLRNPDNRLSPGHPGQRPDTSAPAGTVPAAAVPATVPAASDGGLSTFLIVLIAIGGGVLVAGTAVAATRAILHHPHTLT